MKKIDMMKGLIIRKAFILYLALIIFFLISNASHAEEKRFHGFLDIPFGTSQDKVLSILRDKYDKKPSINIFEYRPPSRISVFGNQILLKNFVLGEYFADVHFYFDQDKNFYSFSFRSSLAHAGYLNTTIDVYGGEASGRVYTLHSL